MTSAASPNEIRLSEEQSAVVNEWGRGLAVTAGAGSGKTTTLVLKCRELLLRDPKAKFAAVSFTERSAEDLRKQLARRAGIGHGQSVLDRHWVMTIHGLCGAILRENARAVGLDGEESIISEAESTLLWEAALDRLWFEDLPDEVQAALDRLMGRESQAGLVQLLGRVKGLMSFGVLERLPGDADTRALVEVASYVIQHYAQLKRRRGWLDFDDLERFADRALADPAVRAQYHARFQMVLVDEFQDTNPVQARIIERLARPDLSNLCVVGDPKQSIYRFRDADVTLFDQFCERMPVKLSLTRNFRSRPGIIEFANRVCAEAFPSSDLRFEALAPQRPSVGGSEVLRLDLTEPSGLADWLLAEQADGVGLENFALLLRKIRGNEKWIQGLAKRGVPLAIGSGGLFWDDPRVRELVAFLKWWDDPQNTLSGAIFLRAPWVGTPDLVLDEWSRQDPTWVKPFFALANAAPSESPMAALTAGLLARTLAPWRARAPRPGELLLALLADSTIEAELGAQLLGLWHRCEEFSAEGLDFHATVLELARAVEASKRERDVPPPRNRGQLRVLTLHASKGLEFPHVILVDLEGKTRAPNAPLLFWDRVDGAYLAQRNEDGERDRGDPEEELWRESESRKNLAESKRLFYVALTRAQERLVLAMLPDKAAARPSGRPAKAAEPGAIYLEDNWRGWIEADAQPLDRILPASSATSGSEGEREVPVPNMETPRNPSLGPLSPSTAPRVSWRRPRFSVTEWNLLKKCPRAYEWNVIRPRPASSFASPVLAKFVNEGGGAESQAPSSQGIDARELGTRIHECLEHLGTRATIAETAEKLRALRDVSLGDDGTAARFDADALVRWAESTPWFQADAAWPELAFEIPVGAKLDDVLVGAMDRVARIGDEWCVLDFKVTGPRKSTAALEADYRFQMELYAWALGRLEPAARGKTRAVLVQITSDGVREVPLTLPDWISTPWPEELARLTEAANALVDGDFGRPQPGPECSHCVFRPDCPEGLQAKSQKTGATSVLDS